MSILLNQEIELLKEMILRLAVDVEDRLIKALRAVRERDEAAARSIIERDAEIDAREVHIEEECLKVLALHQPVASDLRFVVFVLKVDNDLERIGDLSANIAERVAMLSGEPILDIEERIERMADKACGMLRQSLEAVVHLDADAAAEVCALDDAVDSLHDEVQAVVLDRLSSNTGASSAHSLMNLLAVSKELERVADHATNIAEDVLYLATGKVLRHQVENRKGRD